MVPMSAVRELISETRVLDLGLLPAPRLAANSTVHQALQFLVRGRRGAIVIVDGTRPVGIFTERDVVYRLQGGLFSSRQERSRVQIREVMSKPPATVRRQASLQEAIETMSQGKYRHLVVVDGNGDLKGLLTTNDIVQFLTDQFPEDAINLPPRLHQKYTTPEGA